MTTLMVAATGGHLAQLHQLRPRLVRPVESVVWVTFDGPQSRSLLVGETVEYIPYVAPRDYATILANVPRARRILKKHSVRRVVSTGSGIALSFLPLARARGLQAHYIESAARSEGPSLTGRILQRVPGVELSSQYASWAGSRWRLSMSVFDDFTAAPEDTTRVVQRVVVMLGTIEGYGFRGLVERLIELIPPGTDVLWQTGETDVGGLPITATPQLPQRDLQKALGVADLVVAHAGIGSALGALNAGRHPVLVPRRSHRREHVDDHQVQIAKELSRRGLATHREVTELHWADLQAAARRAIEVTASGHSPAD